jgi:hypothetical protein
MQFKHTFPFNIPLLHYSQKELLENLFILNYQLITQYTAVTICKIQIEYHSEESSKLASFDIVKSTESLHYFHIYPRCSAFFKEDIKRLETIVLHEIIHALDHAILHKQHTLAQVESISTQHAFIHFLATLRNEGVAVLVQKLVYQEVVSETLESAFLTLENELNTILRSCISNTVHQRITWNEYQHILHQLHQKIYKYADVIAFTFIKQKFDYIRFENLNDFISNGSLIEKKKLIANLLAMDVSEWIKQLIKIEQANVIRLEIKLELLVHLCSLLNPVVHKDDFTLLDDIPRYAYQKDMTSIIRILEKFVLEKKNIDEIKLQLENLFNNPTIEDIDFEIIYLCEKIIPYRNDETKDLIDLALSYYVSKQDLIHDETLFLGKQDDWIVIESTFILLNLNQINK